MSGIEQGSKFVFVNTMQEQYNCINIKDQNGFSYVCQFGDEYPIMSDLAITYQVKLKKYKITLTKPDDNFEGFDVYVDD